MARRLLLATSLCVLIAAAPARARDAQPISLSLVTPVQIVPASQGIEGFRLNLLYGRNASLTGLDIGIANHVTGKSLGVEWGLVGLADSDFTGLQWNVVTITQTVIVQPSCTRRVATPVASTAGMPYSRATMEL